MKSYKDLIFEMFEESNGRGSGKRLVGFLGIIIALGCIVLLTIREGGTECVEELIQTLMITSGSLLGISSITSVFKHNNITIKQDQNESSSN